RDLRFGVGERLGSDGSVTTPLDQQSLAQVVRQIAAHEEKVESAAVCLLFSFANPAHEQAVARALEPIGIPVSLSHKILPEFREYERTSTTVINAYLVPLMSKYLDALADGLKSVARSPSSVVNSFRKGDKSSAANYGPRTTDYGLRVMQSNGGSVSAA